MTKPHLNSRAAVQTLGLMVSVLALAAPVAAQASQEVPLPSEVAAVIKLKSRVIQGWYEQEKLHVFMMIDGFTVEQGGWTLKARDGVVWFDESAIGQDGRKQLGIYAEENVVVAGPNVKKPLEFGALYLTLETTGDIERRSAPGEDREKSGGGTPLYLRAKRLRLDALAKPRVEPPPVKPQPTEAEKPERPPVPSLLETKTKKPRGEIVITPLDEVRGSKITSFLDSETQRVSIATGGVAVLAGDIEMKADDAVVWTKEGLAQKPDELEGEIYLEGNVVINEADHTLRASRVYYDVGRRRGLILDAAIRGYSHAREIPVYYYAKRVRELAEGRFIADEATFTTSEFGHPHTALHGRKFQLTDLSEKDERGEMVRRIRYEALDVTSSVRGIPTSWWPRMAGDIEETESALRRVQLSQRSRRGWGLESQWYLWKLLGIIREPQGFRKTYLNLDFFSKRGPFVSVESDYTREDFYGEFLGAFVHDYGKDHIAGESVEPPRKERGRVLWRHRQFLPYDWQATAELSYLSDRNFLEEWYEREFKQGKDQETVLHLKKQWDRQAVSILLKGRINDFLTQTEAAPRLEYHLLGQPLLDERLVYHTTSIYEYAHFAPDDNLHIRSSPWTNIADTRHELAAPLQLGFVRLVPFAEGRLSYFEYQAHESGAEARLYGAAGARASWNLTRVYDNLESELWDIHRLRHVNSFLLEALVAGSSLPSRHLFPFDEPGSAEARLARGIDETDVFRAGWRQRWQTKRGPPDDRRNVDWITFDLLMTWFGDRDEPFVAPDDDLVRNNLQANYSWQLSDTTSLVGDVYYATDKGQVRLANVGLSVVRSPRFSYYIGSRYIKAADASVATFGFDYVINPKWKVHFYEQVDFNQHNRNNASRVQLVRQMANWYMILSIELDASRDEKIFFVQFQPVGVPEFRFGN